MAYNSSPLSHLSIIFQFYFLFFVLGGSRVWGYQRGLSFALKLSSGLCSFGVYLVIQGVVNHLIPDFFVLNSQVGFVGIGFGGVGFLGFPWGLDWTSKLLYEMLIIDDCGMNSMLVEC